MSHGLFTIADEYWFNLSHEAEATFGCTMRAEGFAATTERPAIARKRQRVHRIAERLRSAVESGNAATKEQAQRSVLGGMLISWLVSTFARQVFEWLWNRYSGTTVTSERNER